jgi:hypothetical protein
MRKKAQQKAVAYLRYACSKLLPVKYLDYAGFIKVAKSVGTGHWESQPLDLRWDYHEKAVRVARSLNLRSASRVLEMGCMGVQIVKWSHTMDYREMWNYSDKSVNYWHDARITPWPMRDKQYDLFISLRAFQYLAPFQKEAFLEAKRIANHVLIVVPRQSAWKTQGLENSAGIPPESFKLWNGNVEPSLYEETKLGDFYYWNTLENR